MNKELNVKNVPIYKIEPDRSQPRKVFDEEALNELASSIKKYGIMTPLNVRLNANGYYTIISGERRWRAARIAGLKEIPVKIEEVTDQEKAEMALIENLQRENLNPVEEAEAFNDLITRYYTNQDELSNVVGKSRAYISNSIRLLKLPGEILELLSYGKISSGHARALISVSDKEYQMKLAKRIIDEGLSVRDIEKLAKMKPKVDKAKRKEGVSRELIEIEGLEREMTERIGTKVSIKYNKNKMGSVKIDFYSDDELERILNMIRAAR